MIDADVVSWEELAELVGELSERVRGEFDVLLVVTRGGLVPAGILAYALGIRNILVAAVAYYDDDGLAGDEPTFLQFPADPLLHGQRVLIVDEVWDSGSTIHAVIERVRRADDGRPPLQAGAIPRPRDAGSSRRRDRALGRLPVQGRCVEPPVVSPPTVL